MVSIVTRDNLGTDFEFGTEVANKINIRPATVTDAGKVRLATDAEASAGVTDEATMTARQIAEAIGVAVDGIEATIAALPAAVPSVIGDAPASPAFSQRWFNNTGAMVSGVPNNTWATWNGATWSVDTNVGGSGGGSAFTPGPTPPVAPAPGDRWHNTSGSLTSGVPVSAVATWTGGTWSVDSNIADNGTRFPISAPSPAAPSAPIPGDRWFNNSGGVVLGVPADVWATWTGTTWAVDTNVAGGGSGGTGPNATVQVYDADGSFVQPSGLRSAKVTVTGAGAGGAGSDGVAGQASGGTGGSGAETSFKWYTAAELSALGASIPIVVGQGGAPGAAVSTAAAAGGDGGNSSFGPQAARGGRGGTRVPPGTTPLVTETLNTLGPLGLGDINLRGAPGGRLIRLSASEVSGGEGGGSFWGGGPRATPAGLAGSDGIAPGTGGSGAAVNSATGQPGGRGANGIVVVEMFF